jgi:ferredoxin-type protein NapH
MLLSVATRAGVLLVLVVFALWTEYLNLKVGYNNARLVELAAGKPMRTFYEASDRFLSFFGEDPVAVAQTNGGMTWSIRVMGVPFTDPVAALSVLLRDHSWTLAFGLGLVLPLGLALVFGRIFCSYVCPASLVFFAISRLRRLLSRAFYFPELGCNRGVAWGVLAGGLVAALLYGHGIWALLLPYFAIGQSIFHALAFGTLSACVAALIVFTLADFALGHQFTCRNLCPTGRLLGWIGQRSLVTVRRDAERCVDRCEACIDACPLAARPKYDDTQDCSLCGECLMVCPTSCLHVGVKHAS